MDNLITNLHNVINYSPLLTPMDIKWCPLVVNALKLNFDGSSIGNLGPSAIGGTIIDDSGSCLVAFLGPLGMGDALSAELKALLCGVKLIHSKGLSSHRIEVEGDSAVVIGWMGSGSPAPWRMPHILKELAFLVSSLNISFKWILREAKAVANRLAKRGVEKDFIYVGSLEKEMML